MKRLIFCALVALCTAQITLPAVAQDFKDRPEWITLKAELVRDNGYDEAALDAVMARVKRQDRVIAFMDAPIRAPTPWYVYWPRHIGGDRLQRGTEFMKANKASFDQAETAYGVPAQVIAAIIGVETVYGRITGNFRVVEALATLAFDYPRRAEFFRGELKELLLLARDQKKSPFDFLGSFAGAIIAALFLKRFVTATPEWLHVDLYAWNPKDRPGRPQGAEAQGLRALYALVRKKFG